MKIRKLTVWKVLAQVFLIIWLILCIFPLY